VIQEELVVLVDGDGRPVGVAEKSAVHGATTPRHLAFSCYAFDSAGRLLVTRRAASKRTFPGAWTNTCCGHPAPGEEAADAARRRMAYELALVPADLRLVLPDFSYRASADGVEENELCPVFLCRVAGAPAPDPTEVDEYRWMAWYDYVDQARRPDSGLSPWTRLQVAELERGRHVQRYLRGE
jgi:isopentenyl-diphosphate Delta-isomerase